MNKQHKAIEKGFTLIEVLVAIVVIGIGFVSGLTLITRTISFMSLGSARLVASYLAQEGVEIVRNIRDSNWLEGSGTLWDEGLNCPTGCIVDYKHSYGPDQQDPVLPAYSNQKLNIDPDGFYSYDPGTETPFRRKVVIDSSATDTDGTPIIKVLVTVEWDRLGETYKMETQEYLYKWNIN